jgi:HSP20 family protein
MALMRRQDVWDPFRELEEISNRFNRLFGPMMRPGEIGGESLAEAAWVPSCEVSEDDKQYRIRLELPEVDKDNVHVTLHNGMLSVRGERKEEKEDKGRRYHRRELRYGSFVRQFTMPNDIDESKVEANFKDGMLTVTVARATGKQAKVKEIAIQ